jgi:hypothetical protein
MSLLEQELGQRLSAEQVAEFLDVDVRTVREYYHVLGGIRLGRRYVFFERSLIYAVQERRQVDGPGAEGREEAREGLSDQKGSTAMGSREAAKTCRSLEQEDRHGLFG